MQSKPEEKTLEWNVSVQRLVRALRTAGYDTVAVGGCVRDCLLSKEPHDWDLATAAPWYETKRILSPLCSVYETGVAHGTVTAVIDGMPVEITTFRIDGIYQDGRHPKSVTFTTDLRKDLARRDFTINAIAFDGKGLIDPFGGQEDLKKGIIRCVGNPEDRFFEDGLRIVRALRFAATLSFSIEQETEQAIHRQKDRLRLVASERICVEFIRLLCTNDAGKILYSYSDVIHLFFPVTLSKDTLRGLQCAPLDLSIRLAIIGICAQKTGDQMDLILRNLRMERCVCKEVSFLCDHAHMPLPRTRIEARKFRAAFGVYVQPMLAVWRALAKTKSVSFSLEDAIEAQRLVEQSQLQKDCVTRQMLAVDGNDICCETNQSGRQISEAISLLLTAVMEERVQNTKDALLEYLKRTIARQ